MRRIGLSVLAVLTVHAWAGDVDTLGLPKITFEQSKSVCRDASKIVRRIPSEDFLNGEWRKQFDQTDWLNDSDPTITAEGRQVEVPFKYRAIDINNDGKDEVVVVFTTLFSSVDFDWLYQFSPDQFLAAQKKRTVGKLLNQVPELNPRNFVRFSNGETGVPVELQFWHKGKTNYILLKENYFTKDNSEGPNSLFVAKLTPRSSVWDNIYKVQRLEPDMICRMAMIR